VWDSHSAPSVAEHAIRLVPSVEGYAIFLHPTVYLLMINKRYVSASETIPYNMREQKVSSTKMQLVGA